MNKKLNRLRGEHCINVFLSYELKERIHQIAERYDRTMADIVRTLLKVGIPVLEGLSEAEESLLLDYMKVIKKMRRVKKIGMDDRENDLPQQEDTIP